MRNYPTKDDSNDLKRLNCEPWMVDLLKMNPSYTSWGPHEDYMWKRGSKEGPDEFGRKPEGGWDSRVLCNSWSEFTFDLDDLNEVVNFYFELQRDSVSCETCNGSGTHPDAQWVSESFYQHSSPFRAQTARQRQNSLLLASFGDTLPRESAVGQYDGNYPSEETFEKYSPAFREFCEEMRSGDGCWHGKITQDEVDALVEGGRLREWNGTEWAQTPRTADDVNAAQHARGCGLSSHDAINRWILVEARCKRLGLPQHCPRCEGHGNQFTEPAGHVNLILWVLHPRKGCSRGVEVKRIQKKELRSVFAYLRKAAARNAKRFAKIPKR